MAMGISSHDVINHGYMLPDYFQGCGTAFTAFDDAFTGIGDNAAEAYADAVESAATAGYDVSTLPRRPKGIRSRDRVPAKCTESYWYVSIRVAKAR